MKKIVQLLVLLLVYNIAFSQAGKFDSTFSNNGKVITKFNKPAMLHSLALQKDGKIIAVGTTNGKFTIVRYNTDGSRDNSFGDKGIVKGLHGEANAVAIQDNERIVVAGVTTKEGNSNVTVARYKINGSVDTGFGKNGFVTTKIGEIDDCKAVAIQPDGKIVLAGSTARGIYAYTKALLIRLNTDGTYDTNFGDSGIVITSVDKYGYAIGSDAVVRTMALQSDGKIIIGGCGWDVNATDKIYTVLMRFKRNGDLDKSFGNNGRASFNGINIYDIAMQSDGKILCAGSRQHLYFVSDNNYYFVDAPVLSRYTADGYGDVTYNGSVSGFPEESSQNAHLYSVALLPNDKSVSTLQYLSSGESDTTLAVLKRNSKGEVDSAFGRDGEKIFTNPNLQRSYTPTTPILVQPDGKILVGSTYSGNSFYIARLLASNTQSDNLYSKAQAAKTANINKNNFSLYPNPAKTYTTVSFSGAGNYVVRLNDANGNLLQTKNITAAKGLNTVTINVSSYAAGLYFVTLIDDEKQKQTLQLNKQ